MHFLGEFGILFFEEILKEIAIKTKLENERHDFPKEQRLRISNLMKATRIIEM